MTMKTERFAVLILTHGRADNVVTERTLRKQGYTGEIYYVIDNEDEQGEKYKEKYGRNVIVYDKEEWLNLTDTGDNGGNRGVVVPARNAAFEIAQSLGLDYFLELDDDYTSFMYRYEEDGKLKGYEPKNLDAVFDAYVEFLLASNALVVCFAQGGDFIGGANGGMWRERIKRKAMNAFFCRTDRPFEFYGRLNEDATMNVLLGNRGDLIMTTVDMMLVQGVTQANAGGLTDAYLEFGTYLKSFYSVIFCPQAVKVRAMGEKARRLHHYIDWNKCTPRILNEKWRRFEKKQSGA